MLQKRSGGRKVIKPSAIYHRNFKSEQVFPMIF